MRTLLRLLIFWALMAPVFYFLILPMLMDRLNTRARAQSFDACIAQLQKEGIYGPPPALIKQEQAEHYCHCVADGLTLERADLPALAQHKQPDRLTNAMKPVVEGCNKELQESLNAIINGAPAPTSGRAADGTEVIYFNTPVEVRTVQ